MVKKITNKIYYICNKYIFADKREIRRSNASVFDNSMINACIKIVRFTHIVAFVHSYTISFNAQLFSGGRCNGDKYIFISDK